MKIGNLIALNALATANPVAQPNPVMNMLLMEKMILHIDKVKKDTTNLDD